LPELKLPLLLAVGGEDPVYFAQAEAMRDRLQQAELLIIPAAGHLAHLENLPAFATGLRSFLHRHGLADSTV
jgi:pimeloyl-ACP methyl ester carboxylesterase